MKKIISFVLITISVISCKKDDKGSDLPAAKVGDKVTGGYVIYKSADGHGVMLADTFRQEPVTWFTAEDYCADLNHNGYTDWRLPTVEDLQNVYQNAYKKGVGRFYDPTGSTPYWGVTEQGNNSEAWVVYFSPSQTKVIDTLKGQMHLIRTLAVRDF